MPAINGHRLIHHDHAQMSFPIHVLITIIHLLMSVMHAVFFAHFISHVSGDAPFISYANIMIFLSYFTFFVMYTSLLAMARIPISVNLSFHPYVFYIHVCLLS